MKNSRIKKFSIEKVLRLLSNFLLHNSIGFYLENWIGKSIYIIKNSFVLKMFYVQRSISYFHISSSFCALSIFMSMKIKRNFCLLVVLTTGLLNIQSLYKEFSRLLWFNSRWKMHSESFELQMILLCLAKQKSFFVFIFICCCAYCCSPRFGTISQRTEKIYSRESYCRCQSW